MQTLILIRFYLKGTFDYISCFPWLMFGAIHWSDINSTSLKTSRRILLPEELTTSIKPTAYNDVRNDQTTYTMLQDDRYDNYSWIDNSEVLLIWFIVYVCKLYRRKISSIIKIFLQLCKPVIACSQNNRYSTRGVSCWLQEFCQSA